MLSFEYISFLNQKILEYLPANAVRVGDKLNFRCPCCGDSKKSTQKKRGWWYFKNASFYCFNCGTGMSGIKFLELISGSQYESIRQEYIRLFLKSGLKSELSSTFDKSSIIENQSLFNLHSIVKEEWKKPLSDEAIKYLKERRVTEALQYNDVKLYSWYDKKNQEFILIPWTLNGIDSYFQLNDFKKHGNIKYIFPKDVKKTIAGLDNIDVSWPYIICFEGYYDSLFVKNGICLGTKSITEYQEKLIRERYPRHQIVISFDNDSSGIQSMKKIIQKNSNFKFFKWFNEDTKEKDINDHVKAIGDVNIFIDPKQLEKMIIDKVVMKFWLIRNNLWKNDTSKHQ